MKFLPKSPINNMAALTDNGLVPNRRHAIIWHSDGLVDWRTYASLSLSELKTVYY